MHLEDPQFPPLLEGHAVRAPKKPFAEACLLVRAGKVGAGDVVWSRNTGRAEFAVVLEPEVALERALQMGPLLMVALGDCLGSLCPPKVAIQYRWPRSILLNGAMAGEVRIAAPSVPAAEVPAWLVVAPGSTSLPRARTVGVVENLAQRGGGTGHHAHRHPAVARRALLDPAQYRQEEGFAPRTPVAVPAEGREAPVTVRTAARIEGQVLGLDEGANLLLRTAAGKVRSLAYIDSADLIGPDGP
jgi:hypothetical protein